VLVGALDATSRSGASLLSMSVLGRDDSACSQSISPKADADTSPKMSKMTTTTMPLPVRTRKPSWLRQPTLHINSSDSVDEDVESETLSPLAAGQGQHSHSCTIGDVCAFSSISCGVCSQGS
jgi:hypothetical protein